MKRHLPLHTSLLYKYDSMYMSGHTVQFITDHRGLELRTLREGGVTQLYPSSILQLVYVCSSPLVFLLFVKAYYYDECSMIMSN